MSDRYQTTREIELHTATEQYKVDRQKSSDLREDIYMHAGLSAVSLLGAIAVERTDRHFGSETAGLLALSGLFATFSVLKYRQYRTAKDRVFNTWRQKIELERPD